MLHINYNIKLTSAANYAPISQLITTESSGSSELLIRTLASAVSELTTNQTGSYQRWFTYSAPLVWSLCLYEANFTLSVCPLLHVVLLDDLRLTEIMCPLRPWAESAHSMTALS